MKFHYTFSTWPADKRQILEIDLDGLSEEEHKRLSLLREGFIARVERGARLTEAAKIAKCSVPTLARAFSRYATLVNGKLAGWAAVARMSDRVICASWNPITHREMVRDARMRLHIEQQFSVINARGIPDLPGTTERLATRVYEAFYRKTFESPHGSGSETSNEVEALHRFIEEYLDLNRNPGRRGHE